MMALDNNCIQYGNTYNYFTSAILGSTAVQLQSLKSAPEKIAVMSLLKIKPFKNRWQKFQPDSGNQL